MDARPVNQAGFTLLEVMLVIGVVGILAALAVTSLRDAQLNARVNGVTRNLASELGQLRIRAVSSGIPSMMCLRAPSHVPVGAGDSPNSFMVYTLRALPSAMMDATAATVVYSSALHRTLSNTDFASLSGTSVQLLSGVSSAGTVTFAFDGTGSPSVWASPTGCDDVTGTTSVGLTTTTPYTLRVGLAPGVGAGYTRLLKINADGTVSLP